MELLTDLVVGVDRAVIWYFFVLNSCYAVLILLAVPELWRHWQIGTGDDHDRYMQSEALPPISVLMPAFNMEPNIVESVRAQLTLRYPHHEVIVINDGSKDDTFERLREEFQLHEVPPAIARPLPTREIRGYYRSPVAPSLLVIDKENGGKADALNAGLCASRYPLVVAADADTMIENDALLRLARPFLFGEPVVAAGGTIRVANSCDIEHARVVRPRLPRRLLAGLQVPEYLRAFLFGRLGWNHLGGNLIVSGAFGLFRRDHLLEIGGYRTGNVVEDLDLVVRLHKHLREEGVEYRIPLIPDPVAWTEVPQDRASLGRQRERWHRGLIQTLITHRRMLFNPRYGRIGLVQLPFYVFGEMLAPVVELVGYSLTAVGLALGVISWEHARLFLVVALGYGMTLTLWAVILEEATFRAYPRPAEFFKLVGLTLLEPLGYRQMTVWWRLKGFFNTLRRREDWGVIKRYGFDRGPTVGRDAGGEGTAAQPVVVRSPAPTPGGSAAGIALAVVLPSLLFAGCAAVDCESTPAGSLVAEAWTSYRDGATRRAEKGFRRALACDAGSVDARLGLAYVSLRRERHDEAGSALATVVARRPGAADAWVAQGILDWRTGEPVAAAAAFGRALAIDPGYEEAERFAARLADAGVSVPIRPSRAGDGERALLADDGDRVRGAAPAYPARVSGERFEIRSPAGHWEPFYVRGVNLGAALPGRHPSEFPDSVTYAGWLHEMAEMGVNALRVYTIHPPGFYRALREFNESRPRRPLWLIHGVWAELPPGNDFSDPAWEAELSEEMRRVVDAVHGAARIPARPGHAAGSYDADVSAWTLAYIFGREWEPFSVVEFNARHGDRRAFAGEYLRLAQGNPMEAWLVAMCDRMIAYEMAIYETQRPIAYTNWPTLDPLDHPTETTVDEELAIRERLGETVVNYPREYDNDAVGLDATRVTATEAFPAGWFASFHAYPYYPDFMMLDPRHLAAESPWGPSHYFGYLKRLKAAHPGMPVLIAEYGVPAGLQIAHLDPRGWHHGGHTESRMAEIDARLTREIDAAGMAGGVLFAWIDEWFKKNWAVIDFEIPPDRNRLWLNRLDAEQHYGMIAMEPAERLPGRRLEDRLPAWRERPPLYLDVDGALRAHADEAYLWLLFEPGRTPAQKLLIGFDMIDPEGGDHRWPGGAGPVVPVGLELALRVGDGEARLLADPPSNPYRIVQVRRGLAGEPRSRLLASTSRPPGYFEGRLEGWYNAPYVTRPNDDGVYEALRFIPNRPRFATDGTEYLAQGYDRGRLPRGPLPDALWETGAEGEVEVRIPWTLLNVTDPSGRRVLQDPPRALSAIRRAEARARAKGLPRPEIASFETRVVESIRIVAARRSADGGWRSWPRSGATDEVAEFTWPTWEEPTWRSRRRPVFDAMREAFGRVGSPPLAAGGGR